jgi:hypothetical protein
MTCSCRVHENSGMTTTRLGLLSHRRPGRFRRPDRAEGVEMKNQSLKVAFSALLVAAALGLVTGAARAESVMKECGDQWKAAKAAGTTNGQTWQEFLKSCRAQQAPAPAAAPMAAPAPAPVAAAPAATGGESVMKQCGDQWKAAKAAGTTNGQTWQEFLKSCRAQTASAPAAAPTMAPAPAPAPLPAAIQAALPKPAPVTTHPAANPTGAGQFASESEAKARCPSDTVVWVNTKSHIYHLAGTPSYGTTKRGAYMCEADANAAGDRASKSRIGKKATEPQ